MKKFLTRQIICVLLVGLYGSAIAQEVSDQGAPPAAAGSGGPDVVRSPANLYTNEQLLKNGCSPVVWQEMNEAYVKKALLDKAVADQALVQDQIPKAQNTGVGKNRSCWDSAMGQLKGAQDALKRVAAILTGGLNVGGMVDTAVNQACRATDAAIAQSVNKSAGTTVQGIYKTESDIRGIRIGTGDASIGTLGGYTQPNQSVMNSGYVLDQNTTSGASQALGGATSGAANAAQGGFNSTWGGIKDAAKNSLPFPSK